MKRFFALILTALFLAAQIRAVELEKNFAAPPDSAKPWVFWFWINGNVSKAGITADLEAFKRAGVGGLIWMEVSGQAWSPDGKMVALSPQWQEAFQWAIRECDRLGLKFDSTLDFGYGSGGPHITPDFSMQKLVWSEKNVEGGRPVNVLLEKPVVEKKLSAWLRPGAQIGEKVLQAIDQMDSYREVAVVAIPLATAQKAKIYKGDSLNKKNGLHWKLPAGEGQDSNPPTDAVTPKEQVIDLTSRMDRDGRLQWDAPPGKWLVIRYGHASNFKMTRPCPQAAVGLECDRLSKAGIDAHFDAFLKKIIDGAGKSAGGAFAYAHIDSWEAGGQNWTATFPDEFRKRRGYDLRPWLPVMTGRIVGSAEWSERFLWDVRMTVSEMIRDNYAGRLRELLQARGMKLSIEAYGHLCIDNLSYAGVSDMPISEFWAMGKGLFPTAGGYNLSSKAMASAAHTYGKPVVGAESFTSDRAWQDHPFLLKAMGDQAFCRGVNRMVFHCSAHQAYADMIPGMTHRRWGEHFQRNNTWWDYSRVWTDYLSRCQYLLQQGEFVADVCYWFGEGAPLDVNEMKLELPAGYDHDLCSSELVLQMKVRDGRVVLPSGMSYRYLLLPDTDRMTLPLARKIRELVDGGGRVIGGKRPIGSPSLADYPQGDAEVKQIATALWDSNRVVSGKKLDEVFAQDKLAPDFAGEGLSFIHRRAGDADIYFVANGEPKNIEALCSFRVNGKRPEFWQPETGRITPVAAFEEADGVTRIPLALEPCGSIFVVFRPGAATEHLVSVKRNGQELLRGDKSAAKTAVAKNVNTFTIVAWAKPEGDTTLPREATVGTAAKLPRNDALYPPPGHEVWGIGNAGAGFSVGRNGVCVHEHGANYFSTSLAYAVPLADWTHVAIVYRDATPTLFLNGKKVHTGLKSPQKVHPGLGVEHQRKVAPFTGELAGLEAFDRALTESEVAELAKTRPADGTDAAPGALGLMNGLICQSGDYVITTAAGQTRRLNVALPPPQEITGPWQVTFDPKWGGPKAVVTFAKLADWSANVETDIRYYSGTATYRKTFELANNQLSTTSHQLFLDLGKVAVMARVKLNGVDCGTAWKPPYQVDITRAAHAGKNELEIDVVNLWINRMIGDEQLPEDCHWLNYETLAEWPDWFKAGKPRPSGRYTFTTCKHYQQDSPLVASGLLGPVTLQTVAEMFVKP